ncbi:MAG: hypothetical protein Fur0018_14480 [Anaerolineales bacterium]
MTHSLKTHIALLLGTLALLVLVATGATLWGVQAQSQDALVINLAGRQRMLIQQMTLLSVEESQEASPEHAATLWEAADTFERTLSAFEKGGLAPYLPGQDVAIPAAESAEVRATLAEVRALWEPFRQNVDAALAGEDTSEAIRALSPQLLAGADEVVRRYEAAAAHKVTRLRDIQRVFLLTSLLLLAWGVWLLRRSILQPMQRLQAAVQRIADGDLEMLLHIDRPQEFHTLAIGFETMRQSLLQWQQESERWAATLEARVAQRTAELDALNKVSLEIAAQLDTDEVLHSIAQKARQLLGADAAALCLVQEDGTLLVRQTVQGPPQAFTGRQVVRLDEVQEVLEQPACAYCRVPCGMLTAPYRRHHLAVTLQHGSETLGAFCVASAGEHPFPEDADILLTRLANAAVVAMQNARLYDRAEQSAALEERQRLAAELHDGLGQLLASIHLLTDRTLEEWPALDADEFRTRLESIRESSQQAVRIARQAITSLTQAVPSAGGLKTRLREAIADLQTCARCPIVFESALSRAVTLPKEREEQLLHIAQEAIWNAIRHAEAGEIRVRLAAENGMLTLEVADDGRGFVPAQADSARDGHFGLRIMQTRAEYIAGTLEIVSTPGAGTRIVVHCPIEESHESLSLAVSG